MIDINPAYITPLIGTLAVVIFAVDRVLKYKSYKIELEVKKQQIDLENRFLKDRLTWLEQETIKLSDVAKPLGKEIGEFLEKETEWAVNALNEATLVQRFHTPFLTRMNHFRYEKESISSKFVPQLLLRCKNLINNGEKVCLMIDSGTTLYYTFKYLGIELVNYHSSGEKWIDDLSLISNNLAGMSLFMEYGCINQSSRYSPLVIECLMLPGNPLPIYSGVTGEATQEALSKIKSDKLKKDADTVFISVTTGNWARIRRKGTPCPVPVVRGNGHLGVKQRLIDLSNEVYVLAPLGKTLMDVGLEDINRVLRLDGNESNPDKELYQEVDIPEGKATMTKYVSTTRVEKRILFPLSNRVEALLSSNASKDQIFKSFSTNEIEKVPHLFFDFDDLPDSKHLEFEQEVPHAQTRDDEFLKFLKITGKKF